MAQNGWQEHMEEHCTVRSVDPNGETLLWCGHRSGYARVRPGSKLMNSQKRRARKSMQKMLKGILTPEEGNVRDRTARKWQVEG